MANGMGIVDTIKSRLREFKTPGESDIQQAQGMLEKARQEGRFVRPQEMTPAAQTAQKRLIAQPKKNGNGKNGNGRGAFTDAEAEQQRRMQGIGGKGMVR